LVITAPPALLNTMKEVIAGLDVRREQVLVEALLVEVGENMTRSLGSAWLTQNGPDGTSVGAIFDPLKAITEVPDPTPGTTPIVTGPTGILAQYFRAGDLRGVLSALETDDESNVLSTPTILALDNEEAEILVGENVPFKTGEQNSTNAADSDFVQIERQDIGIHLKVTPRVNLNNTITMDIEQKVESINETSKAGASDIITNKRELKTKAIINDNEILVLGGLIRDDVQETEVKVPLLGDIPVIGWLFKGTTKSVVKRNLMVFIHPRILRNNAEGREVTVDAYQRIRDLQEMYNNSTDFLTFRNNRPLLKDLPSSMADPESFPSRESATADVITTKKIEVPVVPEEPIQQSIPPTAEPAPAAPATQ
jgi:general secretion pathway protein D